MSKLSSEERAYRDEMFQQGMLWCANCKQFLPIEYFKSYQTRAKIRANYGYRYYCNWCNTYQHRKIKDRQSQYFKERNGSLKVQFVNWAGGCCQRCGYKEFASGLDFHHVYPTEKGYNPARIIYSGDIEITWKELDKCCLLCSNCHAGYEAGEWRAEFIKRDGLGFTVGNSSPLDDDRYTDNKPPTYQRSLPPILATVIADTNQRNGKNLSKIDEYDICPVCKKNLKAKVNDKCLRCISDEAMEARKREWER